MPEKRGWHVLYHAHTQVLIQIPNFNPVEVMFQGNLVVGCYSEGSIERRWRSIRDIGRLAHAGTLNHARVAEHVLVKSFGRARATSLKRTVKRLQNRAARHRGQPTLTHGREPLTPHLGVLYGHKAHGVLLETGAYIAYHAPTACQFNGSALAELQLFKYIYWLLDGHSETLLSKESWYTLQDTLQFRTLKHKHTVIAIVG